MTNPPKRYGIIPQFLHWMTVILVTLGTFGDDLPKGEATTGLLIHVSAKLLSRGDPHALRCLPVSNDDQR